MHLLTYYRYRYRYRDFVNIVSISYRSWKKWYRSITIPRRHARNPIIYCSQQHRGRSRSADGCNVRCHSPSANNTIYLWMYPSLTPGCTGLWLALNRNYITHFCDKKYSKLKKQRRLPKYVDWDGKRCPVFIQPCRPWYENTYRPFAAIHQIIRTFCYL